MAVHARLSPSSSERWLVCPDAPNAEDAFENKTNYHAELGTAAHELLEMALRMDVDPLDISDDVLMDGKPLPEDVLEAVSLALSYVKSYSADRPLARVMPERRVYIIPEFDIFGHSDIIIESDDELVVIDYKNGYKLVTGWTQHGLYALGARLECGRRPTYRLVTIQPRARHISGPVRELVVDDVWLDALLAQAREAAAVSADPKRAYRVAGEHCRYCLASAVCPTLRELVIKNAVADFTTVDAIPDPPQPARPTLDPVTIGQNLTLAAVVDIWIKAVRQTAYNMVRSGTKVTGYKLVAGKQGNRFFSDPEAVKLDFEIAGVPEDDYAPRDLVSPAGAEKLTKKRKKIGLVSPDLSQYIRRKAPGYTLAPDADPRPAVSIAGAEFNVVDLDE